MLARVLEEFPNDIVILLHLVASTLVFGRLTTSRKLDDSELNQSQPLMYGIFTTSRLCFLL